MSEQVTIGQALEVAIRHHNRGQIALAEEIYRKILAADPENVTALHLSGMVAHEHGDLTRAHAMISQAIARQPDFAEMHGNLGIVLQDMGRHDDAVASYERAVAIDPAFAGAYCNLGDLLQGLGRHAEAVACFEKALDIDPDFAEANNNLGNALRSEGRLEEAIPRFEKALSVLPDYAEAHSNLGNVYRDLGRLDDAVAEFDRALALDPAFAQGHSNRGAALQIQGRLVEAVAGLERAIALDPALPGAHGNIGIALTGLGRVDQALEHHRQAVRLAPEDESLWRGFGACVQVMVFTAIDEDLYRDLLALLERPGIDPPAVAPAILSALRHHPDIARLLTGSGNPALRDMAALARIPLLLRIMALSPLKDLSFEAMLTRLRRTALDTVAGRVPADEALPFLLALAHHCFINEYVFAATPAEMGAVERLAQTIDASSGTNVLDAALAVLAAYCPLHHFEWSAAVVAKHSASDLAALVTQQIDEPSLERTKRETMRRLTAISDATSQSVRTQYEINPYPRWTRFGSQGAAAAIGNVLRGPPLRLTLDSYRSPAAPDILIAGCGTGQHALMTADRFANADILAVDLSLSSLAYAKRMTEALGVKNIAYAQADILSLGVLDRRFDLIESVGVLHHLADPMAGWRVLVDLLRPGGVMKIGLYSEAARQDVVAARAMIAEKAYGDSVEDIRRCRQDILAAVEAGAAQYARVLERDSFFTTSECRDLLFHVQEHRFTLPAIDTALAELGLRFLGFELGDQNIMRRFKATYPDAAAAANLAYWHEFETANPDTFAGMYQFWVQEA